MSDSPNSPPRELSGFRATYDQHIAFVWRSLSRFGVPESCREDLAHEVFIVYFKKYMDYEGPASPSTLLYGVARRVAANHRRGQSRRDAREQAAGELPQSPQLGPDEMIARQDAQDLVERFLGTLSEDNAEIFRLTQVEGLRAKEVAGIFEINLNTLNARIRSAKMKFETFVREEASCNKERAQSV